MNYFLRKYSTAAKRNPATEIVVVIAAIIPSNSLYVFRYATIKPMEITLKKISKESILSNFFFYFSSDYSSGCFNQNVSPTSDSNNGNDCVNIHYFLPSLYFLSQFLKLSSENQFRKISNYFLVSHSRTKPTQNIADCNSSSNNTRFAKLNAWIKGNELSIIN
jgi:hypothetical protein